MPGKIDNSLLPVFASAFQISLGLVFLLSAPPKLRRPLRFARSVVDYKVLPEKLAYGFAFVVITLETFSAIAFLTGWLFNIAAPLAAIMLLAFLVAIGINLRRGRKLSCGCFGEASEQISTRTLARLSMLLAVLLFVVAIGGQEYVLSPTLGTSWGATFLLTLFLAGFLLLLGSWILNVHELFFLFHQSR